MRQGTLKTRKGKKITQEFKLQSKTDQSQAHMCNINNIIAQYTKTGLMPEFKQKVAHYIDNTKFDSFEQAFNTVVEANELFQNLPSEVRKAMDNDPTKLEAFLCDNSNLELLNKHGLIEQKNNDKTILKSSNKDQKQEAPSKTENKKAD